MVDYLNTILKDVELPEVVKIRQNFDRSHIDDIDAAVHETISRSSLADKVKPGASVAIGVGSRGVAEIHKIARATVNEVKRLGGKPFIVPAMGSHGNAVAEGQVRILNDYGVTEEYCGCPIRASMDVVCAGHMEDGTPVYFDRIASEADLIIPINRVKVHTDIVGNSGSGVMKLMVIGLGKHKGASTIHRRGLPVLKRSLIEASQIIMDTMPIAIGIAVVENAYHQPAIIQALEPETLQEEELKLFAKSKELMASLPADQIDFLLAEQFGKDISGSGLDTNIIGRMGVWREPEFERPAITKIVALHMTPEAHGNAVGIGLTDFTYQALVDSIDRDALNTNMLTATYVQRGMIPVTLANEEEAIKAAADTCWRQPYRDIRMMVIKNTAEIETLYVSVAMLEEMRRRDNVEIIGEPMKLQFDDHHCFVPLEY